MSRGTGRSSLRASTCLALVVVVAAALAGCGEGEESQSLTVSLAEQGQETRMSVVPRRASGGLAEITLENRTNREGDAQLLRIEGNRSGEEIVAALGNAIRGQPFPDWFFAAGGIGTIPGGSSATVTQVLAPGNYYTVDTEGQGPPEPTSLALVEVSGESSDEEIPDGDATVTAVDYGYEAEDLPSGEVQIDFENAGKQPHHLIASQLVGDSTAADVERFFRTEEGKPPLREKGTQSTAVLEGGESQQVTLDLKPGSYAFYCFIADRQGGSPHALKGMVDEFEVK